MKKSNDFLWFDSGKYKIAYKANQNGGGMHFGQDYIDTLLKRYNKKFSKCYEFCSGPGYIGFSILGAGIAENLVLSDIYAPAGESVKATIDKNKIEGKVNFYLGAGVSAISEGNIDLVVSNPPHFLNEVPWLKHIESRIYIDEQWKIHKEFFQNISSKISDDAIILLQENALGSSPHDFEEMVDSAGLEITDYIPINKVVGKDWIYYLEIRKKGQ